MNKHEIYFRDEEKMVMVPHVGAVNLRSAIALGLVARDDVNETKHAPRSKRERESTSLS
jgi:hypothetical protein